MISLDVRLKRKGFELACALQSDARVLALHGPSGAGKSTLAHLIAGVARPDSGRIVVDGVTLVDTENRVFLPPEKRRIGVVFQDALLFPHLSVKTNILFGQFFTPKPERRAPFDAIINTLGVGHLLERSPETLSGGERQRVGLARALLSSPRLLLMDEPMAALDHARRLEIMTLIERLRDEFNTPIVLVSHSAEEIARLADEAVIINKGRIVAQGPPLDVLPGASRLIEGGRFGLINTLAARIAAVDDAYGVTRLSHPAGEILVAARLAETGEARVAIKATDIALARSPAETSVRTILHGRIARIEVNGNALAFVTLDLEGGDRLIAAVTRLALDELGLAEGSEAYALVKSVALDERAL
ncbi:molybdenum ABC transporter ATP-binding protein [Methylocystis sp. MJC1]|jgi:molybdate transport system ATP-binding protein|uniref:molybdenum ABC transporter ATP-binding protein n=1 Tax=Methylocystis sp. MJC1 TaxID=2654282 RepID=UPI0013EAFC76|nr:molybdenum ABC transporter ATP-binding protein [Methylocystis sp. MJC1]KAF2990728.1 Sulfate/thiosulfate import ATP-binding protein CysA [Methylocystis sp. MJC1]MBU6528672.1 molybdenum ABC transporter ATP-binding protein [Methylocystis sp. MJC1]UZX11561.1 molybdenum ABC transporter ATP-binding protein [Methylocystis sp. MJC1]